MMYFVPDEIPWENTWMIGIGERVYARFTRCETSFNIVLARILGLSYADLWRYLRDEFGATIHTKDGLYCYATFDSYANCERACQLLESRWNEIVNIIDNKRGL